MRYASITLSCEGEELHPVGHTIAAMADHDIVAIHTLDRRADGTYTELNRYPGERSKIKAIFEREPSVRRFQLSGNSTSIATIRYEALPLWDILEDAKLAGPVVLQWPLEFVADGDIHAIRVTFPGSKSTLGRTIDGLSARFDIALHRTGTFADLRRQRIASLTDQQQERR